MNQQVERNGGHSDPLFKGGHFESSSMEPESELSPDQVLGHVGVPVGGPSIIPPHAATSGYLPFPPAGRARQSWRHGTGGVACLVRVRACPQQSAHRVLGLAGGYGRARRITNGWYTTERLFGNDHRV